MITNEEKALKIATDYTNIPLTLKKRIGMCMQMAQWKDEQFIETAQEDAESYVKGMAKANPDLSACVLNLLETAYIAGRNRIK